MNRALLDSEEPLLRKRKYVGFRKYSLLPTEYPLLEKFNINAYGSYWHPHETKLEQDVIDYNTKLTPDEKHMINSILKFFLVADGVIADNVKETKDEIQAPQIKQYYAFKGLMESIHQESYSHIIKNIIPNPIDQDNMLQELETSLPLKMKVDIAIKYTQEGTFGERIFATSVIEGLGFQSLFMIVRWFEINGLMKGLAFLNHQISKDEYDHHYHPTLFWDEVLHKPTVARAHEIVKENVAAEIEFAKYTVIGQHKNLNIDMLTLFIHYWADRCLKAFKYPPIYGVNNPIDYMVNYGACSRAAFFETQVNDYPAYIPLQAFDIKYIISASGLPMISIGGLTYDDI